MSESSALKQRSADAPLQSGAQLVDLCDPTNSSICAKWQQQFQMRDKLSTAYKPPGRWMQNLEWLTPDVSPTNGRGVVYLHCADGNPTNCTDELKWSGPWGTTTNRLQKIANDVGKVVQSGSTETQLRHRWGDSLALIHVISDNKQTDEPPMLSGAGWYWETASRPHEKALINELSGTREFTIPHASMMKTALKVTGNDTEMAILTVANFTKNMAGIERRQIDPAQIDPTLRGVYEQKNIDSLFARLEGFTDDPNEQYNREGSIYHFYGAMLAGSQLGWVADGGVLLDNVLLESGGIDRIKAAAGRVGASTGRAYWNRSMYDNYMTWIPGIGRVIPDRPR